MKAVILAGGRGSRLGEETKLRPKPMVEIGGMPILWHIMKIFDHFGFREFIICHGLQGYVIKEFFGNYSLHISDGVFRLGSGSYRPAQPPSEAWKVQVLDTGIDTMTGGRLKRIQRFLEDGDFCMTYGDGLANIDITKLIKFHKDQGTLATVTAVRPPARFGALSLNGDKVAAFEEHSVGESGWINGGFFILSPRVLDYIDGDDISWEVDPMARLVREGQLSAYRHEGFWMPMDTPRDKAKLESLWASGRAPWKVWP
ncbi:glucose-1-phosphate cytidylyltransferase [Deltaproteobacteria bacterium PRO3]|nr:glucose-1-phosphate cytidylyltransferase [Deltaproteobacteria bacterium PRO3]